LVSQNMVWKLWLTVMYREKCGVSSRTFSTFFKTPISYFIRHLVMRMSMHMNMKTAQAPISKILPLILHVGSKAPGTIKSLACSLQNCREGCGREVAIPKVRGVF
jgi:hypothetical protein